MNTLWKTESQLARDDYIMRYRLADAALQHAILTKSNKSLYMALSHLSEVKVLDIFLYAYDDLYYQHSIPYSVEVEGFCNMKLQELSEYIVSM